MGSGSGVCQRCGQSGVTPAAAIHAEDATTSVQGTAFRTRDHHAVRATASPVFTELSKLRRAHGRTQSRRRSRYHLWRWVQRYAPELDRRAPSQSQSGVPVIRVGVANHSRRKDHARDPKRPSEVVTQGRHPGTRLVIAALFGVSMAV